MKEFLKLKTLGIRVKKKQLQKFLFFCVEYLSLVPSESSPPHASCPETKITMPNPDSAPLKPSLYPILDNPKALDPRDTVTLKEEAACYSKPASHSLMG